MKRPLQFAVLVLATAVPIVAHYLTGPEASEMHDLYRRLCYVPIVLAGLWFGVVGGLLAAGAVAVLYFPVAHAGLDGNPAPMHRVLEVAMLVAIGLLTGLLADRLRDAGVQQRVVANEVERNQADLRGTKEEVALMEERLIRADRLAALGQLAAGLAHEIRNPLASIKAAVEILRAREQETVMAPQIPDFSAIILEETARLDHTLREFLQFARAEKLRPEDAPHATSVLGALRSVLELTESDRALHHVVVDVDEPSLDVPAGICESLLHQVFLNLLINSVDAMPEGGTFRIRRLPDEGELIVLQTEDTGPGIAADVRSKVFDPFFSTKEQGTGLGLAIVERILYANGGNIVLAPTRNGSSARFILKLPAKP